MTEKTERMGVENKYAFEVHREANKQQIKGAIEAIFGVKVLKVHTMVMPGKSRRWGRYTRTTPA
jgi:large subunit ribosomal protein L23